jgi:hypothetical protein
LREINNPDARLAKKSKALASSIAGDRAIAAVKATLDVVAGISSISPRTTGAKTDEVLRPAIKQKWLVELVYKEKARIVALDSDIHVEPPGGRGRFARAKRRLQHVRETTFEMTEE